MVGSIILLFLLNNIKLNKRKDVPFDLWMFSRILILTLLIFILDTIMWVVDGKSGTWLLVTNYIVTTLYYISNPFICFLLLVYTDFKIYENKADLKKRAKFYAIPMEISTVISLISPVTKWFFVIDATNHYKRGPLFFIMTLIAFFYLVLSCTLAFRDYFRASRKETKDVDLHLALFSLLVIAAAFIQSLFFGFSLIWVCTMLACTSVYINIQNGEISTDHLTGLYNRRRFDQHLQRRIREYNGKHLLFQIMLDLDGFKSINDIQGHIVGDEALMHMARLLRQACSGNDDFIARIGGDEFVVLGERTEYKEIEQLMARIRSFSSAYNQSAHARYCLLPSMGCAVYSKGESIDAFRATADSAMYMNKQERKSKNISV